MAEGRIPHWRRHRPNAHLTNVQTTDAGGYYVVVSESTGSATSATAVVTVGAPPIPGVPQITAQPSSVTVPVGATVALSVTATGDLPLTYQWQKDGFPIGGATNSTLVIPAGKTTDSGRYAVVVSESTGSATSATALVTVGTPPPAGVPQITVQPASVTTVLGGTVTLSVTATSSAALSYQWRKDGFPIGGATSPTLTLANVQMADGGGYYVVVSQATGSVTSATAILTVGLPPSVVLQPTNQGAAVTLTVNPNVGTTDPSQSYRWQLNGGTIAGATSATLTLASLQPSDSGLYSTVVSSATGNATSDPAIVGVLTTSKVIGAGSEIAPNVVASNQNTYDQVLLTGIAATVTADANQITRTSFIDLNDDIVQVEFSGAGTLSLVLDSPSARAAPVNYNQPQVAYMKGHASIVVTGANETTNLSIFTIGRVTAFDPTGAFNASLPISPTNNPANNGSSLFVGHASTPYDGVADIGFVAISSTNGKFGGLRTANASYFATQGFTGVYAPGVTFTGPVYVGDINAFGSATPVLLLGGITSSGFGGATNIPLINGGDLLQSNGQPVRVSGITQLKFVAGLTSQGVTLAAKANAAVLQQNGVDVTAQIVVNPSP